MMVDGKNPDISPSGGIRNVQVIRGNSMLSDKIEWALQ